MAFHLFIFLILSPAVINGDRVLKLITNQIQPKVNGNEGVARIGDGDETEQILVANPNIEEIFDDLVNRYRDKLRQRLGARMLSNDVTEKEIISICGTSASITCGNAVVESISTGSNTIKRCQARKNFLTCIDIQRQKCRDLSEEGYYPILPPKNQIKAIQETAWKTLWTSGACVLEA